VSGYGFVVQKNIGEEPRIDVYSLCACFFLVFDCEVPEQVGGL